MTSLAPIGILRVLQAICLLAASAEAHDTARRLILWAWSGYPLDSVLADSLQSEVTHLCVPGFASVDFAQTKVGFGNRNDLLISVRILGTCDANGDPLVDDGSALGFAMAARGVIDPTIFLNCHAILQAIHPYLLEQPLRLRYKLLARAMVRVVRHELRHILEQTPGHLKAGIYKARLQPIDLVSAN